ncbi:hypothetical protein SAMN05216404_11325 [Nitrosospira multiformis]|uniref:Uncharacterized protein n=1 Tax=Nitrosospira multiformis TaxID=1231 RepID=A0A1H8MLL6_9PROT|nr:hypothetical protein [Nitrosospira multiformis]SEO18138.1 hypothetical protein SAMN05216404_11325 [Nitrosospira multiformis]
MKLVVCTNCGIQNRIKSYYYRRLPICGRCQAPLSEPALLQIIRHTVKYRYWIILGLLVGGAFYLNTQVAPESEQIAPTSSVPEFSEHPPVAPESEQIAATSSVPEVSGHPPVVPPSKHIAATSTVPEGPVYPPVDVKQGIYKRFTVLESIAPFQIITPPGKEHYYVKLVNASTGANVISFFVNGGQTFDTKVPLGTYRVRYATGMVWYGEKHLFGPDTNYSEAEKTFQFTMLGNQINGYTLQLIRQQGGNLFTKSISANQF